MSTYQNFVKLGVGNKNLIMSKNHHTGFLSLHDLLVELRKWTKLTYSSHHQLLPALLKLTHKLYLYVYERRVIRPTKLLEELSLKSILHFFANVYSTEAKNAK